MEFGQRLRREREAQGISLEEIARATKISSRNLQAIEEEDFGKLPGGVFNKGFIRAYAHYLSLNEEQVIADYLALTQEPPPPLDSSQDEVLRKLSATWERRQEPRLRERRSRWPWVLAALALLGVGTTLALRHAPGSSAWLARRSSGLGHLRRRENTGPPKPRSQSPARAEANSQPAITAFSTPAAAPAQPARSTSALSTPAFSTPAPTQSGAPALSADAALSIPAGDEFTVRVLARATAWIYVLADGKPPKQGLLRAGQQDSFRAQKKLRLISGNAGAIDVFFNGRPQESLGAEGVRCNVVFTAAGLQK